MGVPLAKARGVRVSNRSGACPNPHLQAGDASHPCEHSFVLLSPRRLHYPFALLASALVACAAHRDSSIDDRGWMSAAASSTPPLELRPLESCGDTADGFAGWLESFRRYARAQKISERTVATAFDDVTYDAEVIQLDRTQEPMT